MASTFAVDLVFGLKGDGKLREATQKLQGLDGAGASAKAALDRLTGSFQKQGESNAQLAGQLRKLKGEYAALTQAAKDSAKAGGAGFSKDTISRLRGLSTEIGRTREALSSGKTASAGFKAEIERLKSAADGAGRGTKNLGDAAKVATASVGGLGVAIRAVLGPLSLLVGGFAFTKIAEDFGDLDTKIRRLGTAGGDTAALSKQLSEIEKELGGVTSKAELAASAYQSLSAGFSKTADIGAIITASAKAAVGGLANQEEVTSVLVKTLNAYGLEASKAAEVTDIISKAVEVGNVEWSDYVQQLGKVSGMAAASGVSFEELNAFIAASTKGGATAEQAFTGLSGVLTGLMQPTKESQEAAELLGVQWNLTGLNAKGLEGLLEDLNAAQAKNPELAARMVGGAESVRGAFAAAGQGGKLFADSLGAVDNAAGKADQDFKTMAESFANQAKKIDTAFKALGAEIVKAFGPQILEGLKGFQGLLEGFTGFVKSLPGPVKSAAFELGGFALKVWAVHAALKAVTGLKALVAATMVSTATTTATAGGAAAVATPKLLALAGALKTLAGIGIVTVGIQLVVDEIGKVVADAKAISNSTAAGGTKSLEAQYKGQDSKQLAASRAVAQANLTNDRKTLKRLQAQQLLSESAATSSMDRPAASDNTELMAVQARIRANEQRIAFLNRQAAVAAKQEKATKALTERLKPQGGGAGTNPGLTDQFNADGKSGADNASKEAEKLAREQNQYAQELASNRIALDGVVFRNKQELLEQGYQLEQQLQNKALENWSKGFQGAARSQADAIRNLLGDNSEVDGKLRDLENRLAAAQQKLREAQGGVSVAQMAPGGSGAADGYISKEALRKWLISQGMGRTSGDFTNEGHKTPNHMLNAMDMGFTSSKYDSNYVQKAKEMEAKLRATGAFGNQLFGPTSDPRGHKDHLHIPTPGGMVPNTPGLQALMGGTAGAPSLGGDMSRVANAQGGVEQAQAEVQGLIAQIEQLKSKRQEMIDQNLTSFVLDSTEAFKGQTYELENQLKAMQLRNRLEMEGVSPEVIEGELRKLDISRQLAERLDVLKNALDNGKMKQEAYNKVTGELAEHAERAANAVNGLTAASVAAADPVAQLVKKWKTELSDTRGMITSLAQTVQGELAGAMSNAISGVISGTMTVKEAFSQMFKNIGKAFIDMATQMIAKALIMKVLGILGGGLGGGIGASNNYSGTFGGGSSVSFNPGAFGGGMSFFADGGYVTGPTPAVVGEGGESEYVLPASKMPEAMRRYSAGARGSSVIPGSSAGGGGESYGGGSSTFTLETVVINNIEYATVEQVRAMGRQSAQQGAAAGHSKVFGDLRNSRSQRARIGMR